MWDAIVRSRKKLLWPGRGVLMESSVRLCFFKSTWEQCFNVGEHWTSCSAQPFTCFTKQLRAAFPSLCVSKCSHHNIDYLTWWDDADDRACFSGSVCLLLWSLLPKRVSQSNYLQIGCYLNFWNLTSSQYRYWCLNVLAVMSSGEEKRRGTERDYRGFEN